MKINIILVYFRGMINSYIYLLRLDPFLNLLLGKMMNLYIYLNDFSPLVVVKFMNYKKELCEICTVYMCILDIRKRQQYQTRRRGSGQNHTGQPTKRYKKSQRKVGLLLISYQDMHEWTHCEPVMDE